MRITLAESAVRRAPPSPWLAGSLALHAAAVSLLLLRAAGTSPSLPAYVPEVLPPYVEVGQEAAPVSRPTGVTAPSRPHDPPPVVIPVVDIPNTVPPAIPTRGNEGQSLIFDNGGQSRITRNATLTPISDRVFDVSTVERAVRPLPGNPSPRYPATLARAGVEGEVTVRFVVDTAGRVERGSIRIVRPGQELFERAVLEVLPLLRFQPAEVGGVRVRQAVEQPFRFELSRRHDEESGP